MLEIPASLRETTVDVVQHPGGADAALGQARWWLFSDTVKGAKGSASLYSLVQTARANDLEPYAYLRRLFTELPAAESVADFEALLPWGITRVGQQTSAR